MIFESLHVFGGSFYQGEEHPCPKNIHVWFKGGFSAGVLGESAPFLLP